MLEVIIAINSRVINMNRITLICMILLYNGISNTLKHLDSFSAIAAAFTFWIVFFWWFDSIYEVKKQETDNETK